MSCSHKFMGTNVCVKCGADVAEIKAAGYDEALDLIAQLRADLATVTDQCNRQEHGFAQRESALQKELAAALKAYDDEVTGRREEVTKCHAEIGSIRQKYQDALRTVGTSNAELAKAEARVKLAIRMLDEHTWPRDRIDTVNEVLAVLRG